jgi:5-methylcytosine-specific restriction protein A
MNRKQFIESKRATCSNWAWSWSFVNHEERVVIFGAWNYHAQPNSYLILDDNWELSDKGRRQAGYSQAIEHIALIRDFGYALMTFTMYPSDKHKDENGHGPAKIDSFEEHLTLRTLKEVGHQYFAVELSIAAAPQSDDTLDDLPGIDYSGIGADEPGRYQTTKSNVKRDPRVRRKVIERAKNGCERSSCADSRAYPGFLDVHHILGIEASDRVWTCVALCPNCHRESHFSPDREKINRELLTYAVQFRR